MSASETDGEVSATKLRVLISKRKTLRGQATRNINKMNNVETIDGDNVEAASVLLERFKSIAVSLEEVDALIADQTPAEEIEDEMQRAMDYRESLDESICTLQFSGFTHQKLPELQLTTFNGDPLRWEEFWDDFASTVDSREDLTVIDKFKLLKRSLKGEALRIADGYLLTNANYKEVKEALKERYGDEDVAVFAHFQALLAMEPANYELKQLQAVRDGCETHIRSLVALGLTEDTYGRVFVPILLSKLPKSVQTEMHRKNGSDKWTLSGLRGLLKEELTARDRTERYSTSSLVKRDIGGNSKKPQNRGGNKDETRTASSLVAEGKKSKNYRQKRQKEVPPCIFCSGAHPNWKCAKYPDVDSRTNQVMGRCFKCFRDNHRREDCTNTKPCYYCKKNDHNSSLCFKQFGRDAERSFSGSNKNSCTVVQCMNPDAKEFVPQNVAAVCGHGGAQEKVSIMKTALATIIGEKGKTLARIIFDDGSTLSFIRTGKAKEIGAKCVGYETTSLGRFMDSHRKTSKFQTFEVNVVLKSGEHKPLQLNSVQQISTPVQLIPLDEARYPFLKSIELAQPKVEVQEEVEIDILLGLDYYYEFMLCDELRCGSGLVIKPSTLGYLVTGYVERDAADVPMNGDTQMLLQCLKRNVPEYDIERFWKLEDVGIVDKPGLADDEIAMDFFNRTVSFENGRYCVKWPYKEEKPELPDNYGIARKRLTALLRRIQTDTNVMDLYSKTIADQLKLGVIEKAPAKPQGLVHYLPHHCVLKPSSATTKLRIVFDASVKANKTSPSLNESLYRGPVMLNDLCGLLIRFRLKSIAIVSDVEKAFFQIMLHTEDRDVTRFIWLRDTTKPATPDNLIEYRFARVMFGTNASPFLLGATITHHMKLDGSSTALEILDNTYMDNVISTKGSLEEAKHYYQKAKLLFQTANMNLREWFSNSCELIQSIPEIDRGKSNVTSVLGLKWDTLDDTLKCSVGSIVQAEVYTKRQTLKAIASVYDPCGWFSPVCIRGRILIQTLWKQKLGWDDKLPPELKTKWKTLLDDLIRLPEVKIPRFLNFDINGDVRCQLHVFCDASKQAYTSTIYLKVEDDKSSQNAKASLIFAKSRVAPVKELSIPRLELMAVVIGLRLLKFVREQLKFPIERSVVWSDSHCVLHWLRTDVAKTVFVENRLKEIHTYTDIDYRYVPTAENPADLATRGTTFEALRDSRLWWCGPSWLIQEARHWPQNITPKPSIVKVEEADKSWQNNCQLLVPGKKVVKDPLFDEKRFKSLNHLLRITCYVLRFLDKIRRKASTSDSITASEMKRALLFWEKRVQFVHFEPILSGNSSKDWKVFERQLGLFLDETGVIRCCGRYGNALKLQDSAKCPKLLPKHDAFTKLVIKNHHERVFHSGVKHTLADLRQKYWIPQARFVIKNVLNECFICRKYHGGTFRVPDPPPLPECRVTPTRPFASIGLDYLGPVYISQSDASVAKAWICLFTCTWSRAIHLEVVETMSTSDFLLCFRRFMALYGVPSLVISDNAKQFRTADHTLKKLWKEIEISKEIIRYMSDTGIEWKRITELAPWMGGFYERLVRPVKDALKKCLDRRQLKLMQLQTTIYEISAVLNNRPLVYCEDEANDQCLTPLHLLSRAADQFPCVSVEEEEYRAHSGTKAQDIVKEYKAHQQILNHFWTVWQNQYLLSLRERFIEHRQRNASNLQPSPGMLVLIKENLPRGRWKYGRITRLIEGSDGKVRTAEVKTSKGNRMLRPLKLLCPMELCDFPGKSSSSESVEEVGNVERRLRRKAAERAEKETRRIFDEEED